MLTIYSSLSQFSRNYSVVWTPSKGDAGDVLTCNITLAHTASSRSPAMYVDVYAAVAANSYASVVEGSILTSMSSIPPTYVAVSPPYESITSTRRLELGVSMVHLMCSFMIYCTNF